MSWYRDDDGKIITDEEFGSDCDECSIFCQEGRITIPCKGERTDCPYFKEVDTSEYDKKIYNKAIDDFVKNIKECSGWTPNCIESWHDVCLTIYTLYQIAEELKRSVQNDIR